MQGFRRLALDRTNHETAETYGISTKTVDTCRRRMLKKRNLRNNGELPRFTIRNKLID
jgi:DNA-binding NarL/FixJ family response regulator